MNKTLLAATVASALAAGLALPALAAPNADKAPAKKITLFYPGNASIEWMLKGTDHGGAKALKKNETCAGCHDQEAVDIGKKIVSGEKLEANPPKGKPGSIPVTVQAAHDGTDLVVRVQWKDTKATGGPKQDAKSAVKVAMMIDAGKVQFGPEGGCWATCHHDLRSMPDVNKDAAKHASAKKLGILADGPTKYLSESRTAIEVKTAPRGGWDKLKADGDLDAALKGGQFLEILQWRSGEKPRTGYVLDARHMKDADGAAEGKKDGDTWTVTFKRKLASAGAGSHAIEAGKLYNIGVAIHDDHSNARYHHVSLGYSLGLDNAKADINAVKQ